jgi:hypothetical protein
MLIEEYSSLQNRRVYGVAVMTKIFTEISHYAGAG